MCYLLELLRAIPAVIWSGVIASALTLSGVLLTNRESTRRLRIQLEHSSREAEKERASAARRSVYLETAEQLTKANSSFASLPSKDPTKENLGSDFQGFFSAAAKLQLVAEPSTALMVNRLAADYGEVTIRLVARVMPIHEVRNEIKIHERLYDQAQAQIGRVIGEQFKFVETAQTNQMIFESLKRSYEHFSAQAMKHAGDRDAAWARHNRLQIEFTRELLGDLRRLGEKHIPVMVEIRRDLGFSTDLTAYQREMEIQWGRISTQLGSFLSDVERKLADISAEGFEPAG